MPSAAQRAGTLSGGQAQRVGDRAGAGATSHAVLADEPVASLDPEAAEEVMRLLRRLRANEGLGVMCVLHQPELARATPIASSGCAKGRWLFDTRPHTLQEERRCGPRTHRGS